MTCGGDLLKSAIRGYAEDAANSAWKPTTYFLAAIIAFAICLITALLSVLLAIALPTISLMLFVRGLLVRLVTRDLRR
jgi:hypothetical protein